MYPFDWTRSTSVSLVNAVSVKSFLVAKYGYGYECELYHLTWSNELSCILIIRCFTSCFSIGFLYSGIHRAFCWMIHVGTHAHSRSTLEVPIFWFIHGEPLLVDKHHQAKALSDMVIVVQSESSSWESHLQCNGESVLWDLRLKFLALDISVFLWRIIIVN